MTRHSYKDKLSNDMAVMELLTVIDSCTVFMWVVCYRPKDTPFDDGTFKLTMQFTEEYPNKPPTVRFVSKMFHPNGELNTGVLLGDKT